MDQPKRKIIRELRFDEDLRLIESSLARADELLRGVTWILERTPDRYGTRISQWDDLWVIPAADMYEKEVCDLLLVRR